MQKMRCNIFSKLQKEEIIEGNKKKAGLLGTRYVTGILPYFLQTRKYRIDTLLTSLYRIKNNFIRIEFPSQSHY